MTFRFPVKSVGCNILFTRINSFYVFIVLFYYVGACYGSDDFIAAPFSLRVTEEILMISLPMLTLLPVSVAALLSTHL